MALEYGYFDSEITGYDKEGMPVFDRAKTSDFMADFFSKLITSGVLAKPSDCFQVIAHEGLTVQIKPGYGFIKGRFAYDVEPAYLTLEDAPALGAYNRLDMIVLRNNYAERTCEIIVKTGTSAAVPKEPDLIQVEAGDYYELCLALIQVRSNQTVISQADITDTRFDSTYCGPVTQLIDGIDTAVFFAQLNQFYKDCVEQYNVDYADFIAKTTAAYNNLNTMMDKYYENLLQRGEALYEQYGIKIADYILQLKTKGDADLAALTKQLIDFRNENEEKFLVWVEHMKDILGNETVGELLLKISELTEQVEFNQMMIITGNVLSRIETSQEEYLIDSMGNPILAGWPICKCK